MMKWYQPLHGLAALHGVRPYVLPAVSVSVSASVRSKYGQDGGNAALRNHRIERRVRALFALLGLLLAVDVAHAQEEKGPSTSVPDRIAIERVLDNYTKAVTNRDEALFMTTLLDEKIPFFSAGDLASQASSLNSADTRAFATFRHAVFHSGTRFKQTFDHVTIQQDGSLATVYLHFITQVVSSEEGGEGWKTLQLLKVGDQWKIVSEFYTVRALSSNTHLDKP